MAFFRISGNIIKLFITVTRFSILNKKLIANSINYYL